MGDHLHEGIAFDGAHFSQKILFRDHPDDAPASIDHRGSRDALFGQQGGGRNQILVCANHMDRRCHHIGGFERVHHPVLCKGIGHLVDFPEIGRGDVDISLHGFHGFHHIGIGNVDGGTFSKVAWAHDVFSNLNYGRYLSFNRSAI